VTSAPALHVPDEPTIPAQGWLAAILDGGDLTAVLTAEDGLVTWLWSRWSALDAVGLCKDGFSQIVVAYRREIWLWLAGERTWGQACSGLIGRVGRRLLQGDAPVE